jgi:hypothetical protein
VQVFFTKSARVLAIVAFVIGILSLSHGIGLATGFLIADPQVNSGIRSPGRSIDRGIYTILFAIVLGVLAEISFSVRKMASIADFNFSMGKRAD